MAREFAKEFYQSKEWKNLRNYIFKRDKGLCQKCGEPGKIVHHKVYLTPNNIHDPNIALNEDNLVLLCKDCHEKVHNPSRRVTREGFKFNAEGKLEPISPPSR